MKRPQAAKIVWLVTALWLATFIFSLHYNWLGGFFFDTSHAHVQGIDFFPVERAFLNLAAGRSEFDTFALNYGPNATWFLYHPLLALVIGPLLAAFKPWTAYALWAAISIVLMTASAWVILRRTDDPLRRALVALLMLGSFPVYIMLYVGNVQALLVLSVTLVLVSVDAMRDEGPSRRNTAFLLAGLLISLFSKPAVLAMLPLLLILKDTRRTTLKALGIYIVVSLAFLVVPALNPVATTWDRRIALATHPSVIAQTMNVYTNGFQVTPAMKDNSVHWFAMLGLVDFRFEHVDVYSLPTFLDGLLHTRTIDALYRIPAILILEMTLLLCIIRTRTARLEASLMVLMAASLLVFLSYGLVWEYHYTGVLPIAALLLIRKRLDPTEWAIIALSIVVWLPSLYITVSTQDATQLWVQTLIRLDRVVPVLLIFCLLLIRATRIALKAGLQSRPTLST
jgi:hypothetical protein